MKVDRFDKLMVGCCSVFFLLGCVALFLLVNPTGMNAFLQEVWIGIKILFFAGLAVGGATAYVRIRHAHQIKVVRDGGGDRVVRAVVQLPARVPAQVIQISPATDIDPVRIMQMQQIQVRTARDWLQLTKTVNALPNDEDDEWVYLDEDGNEVDPNALKQLPPPKVYTLSDQIHSGETRPDEETSVIGYVEGEAVRGKLFAADGNMMDGIFVAGDQGFGKSAFAVYMAALCVNNGGRLIVIDPDAEFEQSLTDRLGALANDLFLLCPIADTPEKAEHALKIATEEIEHPGQYPVLLLVDEFSMLMRHAESGSGKWAEVGQALALVLEDWATRGRKRRRKPIVLGQITKAKRAGGTEVRDSMVTICFHLKKKRALAVLDAEEAEITPTLGMGEVLVIPARADQESYRMQLPYADEDGVAHIAETAKRRFVRPFRQEELSVSRDTRNDPETGLKDTGNVVEITPEMAFQVRARRVAELLKQGKTQTEIIELLYRVRPGGSVEYARARDEVRSIIAMIAVAGQEA